MNRKMSRSELMKRLLFARRQVDVALHHLDVIPRSRNDMLPNDIHRHLIAASLSIFVFAIGCAAMKPRNAKTGRRRVEQLEIAEVPAAYTGSLDPGMTKNIQSDRIKNETVLHVVPE